jgi:hypothetical protein
MFLYDCRHLSLTRREEPRLGECENIYTQERSKMMDESTLRRLSQFVMFSQDNYVKNSMRHKTFHRTKGRTRSKVVGKLHGKIT